MCDLYKESKAPFINGFKVVAKKDGKYYSLAMGFEYDGRKNVPIVERQNNLTDNFSAYILHPKLRMGFRQEMIGRSAIFIDLKPAENIFKRTIVYQGYTTAIVKARVSKDIMLGKYGHDEPVAAGRRIQLLEEVQL